MRLFSAKRFLSLGRHRGVARPSLFSHVFPGLAAPGGHVLMLMPNVTVIEQCCCRGVARQQCFSLAAQGCFTPFRFTAPHCLERRSETVVAPPSATRCLYICTSVHMRICIHEYMYICKFVHMYICIRVWMYICIYAYMYICIYVCDNTYRHECMCIYRFMCVSCTLFIPVYLHIHICAHNHICSNVYIHRPTCVSEFMCICI